MNYVYHHYLDDFPLFKEIGPPFSPRISHGRKAPWCRRFCRTVSFHGAWRGGSSERLWKSLACFLLRKKRHWLVVEPPLWKNKKVSWDDYSQCKYGKINNVPNQQPGQVTYSSANLISCDFSRKPILWNLEQLSKQDLEHLGQVHLLSRWGEGSSRP